MNWKFDVEGFSARAVVKSSGARVKGSAYRCQRCWCSGYWYFSAVVWLQVPWTLIPSLSVFLFSLTLAAIMAAAAAPVQILALVIPDGEAEALVKTMDSEFTFLLQEYHLDVQIQARLVQCGFSDMVTFAKVDRTEDGLRSFIDDEVRLHRDLPNKRSVIAKLITVWESCQERGQKRRAEDAELPASVQPYKLPSSNHLILVKAYTAAHRQLQDHEIPAEPCVDRVLGGIKKGNMVAERLTEIAGKEQVTEDDLGSYRIEANGSLKIRRDSKVSVAMPANPEECPDQIRTAAAIYAFARLQVPSCWQLRGLTSQDWLDHQDWILGEE